VTELDLYHDFDADLNEQKPDGDPVSFKLGGKTFHCIRPLPLGSILVLAKNALNRPDDLEAQAKQVNLLWSFIEPDEHDDLDAVVTNLTDPDIIRRVLEHIMTAGSGYPTPGSSS
jgi:hypothetical protein